MWGRSSFSMQPMRSPNKAERTPQTSPDHCSRDWPYQFWFSRSRLRFSMRSLPFLLRPKDCSPEAHDHGTYWKIVSLFCYIIEQDSKSWKSKLLSRIFGYDFKLWWMFFILLVLNGSSSSLFKWNICFRVVLIYVFNFHNFITCTL